jgi:hypothetical protein
MEVKLRLKTRRNAALIRFALALSVLRQMDD